MRCIINLEVRSYQFLKGSVVVSIGASRFMLTVFFFDRQRPAWFLWLVVPGGMPNILGNPSRTLHGRDRPKLSWKRMVQGCTVWSLPEPLLEKVEELVRWFLKEVELSKEEVRVELDGWAASVVVTRNLGRRVVMKAVVKEFGCKQGSKERCWAMA